MSKGWIKAGEKEIDSCTMVGYLRVWRNRKLCRRSKNGIVGEKRSRMGLAKIALEESQQDPEEDKGHFRQISFEDQPQHDRSRIFLDE